MISLIRRQMTKKKIPLVTLQYLKLYERFGKSYRIGGGKRTEILNSSSYLVPKHSGQFLIVILLSKVFDMSSLGKT